MCVHVNSKLHWVAVTHAAGGGRDDWCSGQCSPCKRPQVPSAADSYISRTPSRSATHRFTLDSSIHTAASLSPAANVRTSHFV